MNFLKFCFNLLIIQTFVRTSISKIIFNEWDSRITETTVKIVKTCHAKRGNAIGFIGEMVFDFSLFFEDPELLPVLLFDSNEESIDVNRISKKLKHRLQSFVIIVSSAKKLESILRVMKNSKWWNHMAYVTIVESPVSKIGCSEPFEILWSAWKMNLLDVNFLCNHVTKGRLIYTFNPYTNNAPDTWKIEKIYKADTDHPWVLLVRGYFVNDNSCDDINFPKTKQLGGYEIRASVSKMAGGDAFVNTDQNGVDSIVGMRADIIKSLFHSLNATMKLVVHKPYRDLGSMDKNGTPDGILGETVRGVTDISFIGMNQLAVANLPSIYPHYLTRLSVLTQYKGHKSQLDKIASVIDSSSQIGACIIVIVTLIFFKCFLRCTMMTSILNVIRLISNGPLINVTDNIAARIYLTSLFIFLIIFHAIYSGQLASLLAKQQPLQNLNTLDDLVRFDQTIYCHYYFTPFIKDWVSNGRIIEINRYDCTEYIKRDTFAACMSFWNVIAPNAARLKLHQSSNVLVQIYISWVIREDWPLEKKFNRIVQSASEAYLFDYAYLGDFASALNGIERNDDADADTNFSFKILALNDLSFAFTILAIGLGSATLSFVIEIAYYAFRKKTFGNRAI